MRRHVHDQHTKHDNGQREDKADNELAEVTLNGLTNNNSDISLVRFLLIFSAEAYIFDLFLDCADTDLAGLVLNRSLVRQQRYGTGYYSRERS